MFIRSGAQLGEVFVQLFGFLRLRPCIMDCPHKCLGLSKLFEEQKDARCLQSAPHPLDVEAAQGI